MDVVLQGQVGAPAARLATGVEAAVRLGGDRSIIAQLAGSQYYDLVKRGLVYMVQTAATGVAPGTAMSTSPPIALHNPANSEVDVVILAGLMGYVSGTLGAGFVSWGAVAAQSASPTGGTDLTSLISNAVVGNAVRNAATPYQGSTVASTPVPIRPFCSNSPLLATSVLAPYQVVDRVDGGIIVAPGAAVALQQGASANQSSPLVVFGLVWAELPR